MLYMALAVSANSFFIDSLSIPVSSCDVRPYREDGTIVWVAIRVVLVGHNQTLESPLVFMVLRMACVCVVVVVVS